MSEWTEFRGVETPPGLFPEGSTTWLNSRYQVTRIPVGGGVDWLSIKRLKKEHVHDWRELWRIKNELTHPDREGFELYPGAWRVVDETNQYHLFVLPAGVALNVGYVDPSVHDEAPNRYRPHEPRQRPLPSWMREHETGDDGATRARYARPVDDDGRLALLARLDEEGP